MCVCVCVCVSVSTKLVYELLAWDFACYENILDSWHSKCWGVSGSVSVQ